MTDEQLGAFLGAFANYYWSVPVSFAVDKIADWHPEVTAELVGRVLMKSNNSILPEKRKDNADDFLCNHVRFYQEFFDSDVTEPAQASEMPADEI